MQLYCPNCTTLIVGDDCPDCDYTLRDVLRDPDALSALRESYVTILTLSIEGKSLVDSDKEKVQRWLSGEIYERENVDVQRFISYLNSA